MAKGGGKGGGGNGGSGGGGAITDLISVGDSYFLVLADDPLQSSNSYTKTVVFEWYDPVAETWQAIDTADDSNISYTVEGVAHFELPSDFVALLESGDQYDFRLHTSTYYLKGKNAGQTIEEWSSADKLTFTAAAENTDPNAISDTYTIDEDTPTTFSVLDNDTDQDGDALSVSGVGAALNGLVTLNSVNNTIIYTPFANFHGTDSFTYTISDGNGGTATATVTVTVTAVNDAASFGGDTDGSGAEDGGAITGTLTVSDPDGITDQNFQIAIGDEPSNGTASINSSGDWSYSPDANYDGNDSFTVSVIDDDGNTETQVITITVTSVNDAATFGGDVDGSGDEDGGDITGALTVSDPDGIINQNFQIASGDEPSNGTASINSSGDWSYSPDLNFNGGDSFTVSVVDDDGNTETQVITITVTSVNDAPVAVDDSVTTTMDASKVIDVLSNDSDPEDDALTVVSATGALHGTTQIINGMVTYTPDAGYIGTDTFVYTIEDALEATADATVTVTITAIAEPPADSFTPTDDIYSEQWHLQRLGDLEKIWAEYTGAGVVVAIYDDGVEWSHTDLDDNYDSSLHLSFGGSELDPAPTNEDEANHGTAVAGVIAAEANGSGTVGVAFDATLTGVKIFSGVANINHETDTSGFEYVMSQQHLFDIVNHSWGGAPLYISDDPTFAPQIVAAFPTLADAAESGRNGLGTNIVKAAGNWADSSQGDYLDTTRHTITVAAYDYDGDASWYSSRGANVLVSAPSSGLTEADADGNLLPGSDLRIATTDRDGGYGYADDGWSSADDTSGFGGTSSATPTVAGVIALMLEANPDLGWRDVQNILAYSARHTGGEIGVQNTTTEVVPVDLDYDGVFETTAPVAIEYFTWNYNGAENWNGGGLHYVEDYGFGAVDAYNAVRMAEVWHLFDIAQTSANEVTAGTGQMTPGLSVSGDGVSASWQFTYSGAAMSLEYVDITIQLNTTLMQEVTLKITSPEGTTATLLDLPLNDYTLAPVVELFPGTGIYLLATINLDWTFGAHAFKGEDPNGDWTVTLAETDVTYDDAFFFEASGNTLNILELDFYGTTPDADDVYHYTDEVFDAIGDEAARQTLSDADGEDWLNLAAMTSDLYVDLAQGADSTAGGIAFLTIADGSGGTVATDIENVVAGDGNDTLIGNALDNHLLGMRGDDILIGGTGNNTLEGGADSDVFVFADGFGSDLVLDWGLGDDVLNFTDFGEFSTYEEFLLIAVEIGNDVVYDLGGDSLNKITFVNVTEASFASSDFDFSTEIA